MTVKPLISVVWPIIFKELVYRFLVFCDHQERRWSITVRSQATSGHLPLVIVRADIAG